MQFKHCEAFGFDRENIRKRLRLLELGEKDEKICNKLHQLVIIPNASPIINKFYNFLVSHREFSLFLSSDELISKLKKTQLLYLKTLGIELQHPAYFDLRLRIGVAHNRIGMPLNLYICAYNKLLALILEQIPPELEENLFLQLQLFSIKVVNLDISLAIDSYLKSNIEELSNNIETLEKQAKQLKSQSEMDPLTHVANRMGILSSIHSKLNKAIKHHETFHLIMLDINKLGEVNDQFGHMIGDLVLKSTVEKINHILDHRDKLGRYGGDEFIIVTIRNKEQTDQLIKSIYDEISQNIFHVEGHELKVSLSIGTGSYETGDTLPGLLNRVDKDLIRHKNEK